MVYSSYEDTTIRQLADTFPQYSNCLLALCDRMLDLLAVVKSHYYHPGFHGGYSLKAVLASLVPELSYDDLEVQGGRHASVAFAQMIAPDTAEAERRRLRQALLDYCKRDSEALVHVLDSLLEKARTPRP